MLRLATAAVAVAVAVAVLAGGARCYDSKFDRMDVDRILASDAMFSAYVDCMLDKGPCSLEHSAEIKQLLPEIISEACAKCSDVQKKHIRKVVRALFEKKPDETMEFRKKFDPSGVYETKFNAFLLEDS